MSDKYKIDLLNQDIAKKEFLTKIKIDKQLKDNKLTVLERDLHSNYKSLKKINSLLDEENKKSEKNRKKELISMQKKIEELNKNNQHIINQINKCMFDKNSENTKLKLEHTKTKLQNINIRKELKKCNSLKNSSLFHKYAVMKDTVKKNLTN